MKDLWKLYCLLCTNCTWWNQYTYLHYLTLYKMTYKHKNKHKVEAADSTKHKNTQNKNEFLAHIAHAKLKKIWSRIDKNDTKTDGTPIYNNYIINNYTVF